MSILNKMEDLAKMTGFVAVKVETLVNKLEIGIVKFLDEFTKEPEKAKSIQERAVKFFCNMSKEEAEKLIEWGESMLRR